MSVDIGKVISGLESLCKKRNCPFVCFDALELIKKQDDALIQMRLDNEDLRKCYDELTAEKEARKPIYIENEITRLPVAHCSKCKKPIKMYLYGHDDVVNFCYSCGQAVKWND